MNIPTNAINKLKEFKQKEKFMEDMSVFYPGIGNEELRPILSAHINQAADDFKVLIESGLKNEKDFQDKIELGLQRFSGIYLDLDTEDRERICHYFEELMEIVGLESSDGHLNNFLYDFDPSGADEQKNGQ